MNHTLLGEVMGLILNDAYYAGSLVHGTRNSVYFAVKHDKCFVHRVAGEAVGYCTWGFFTEEELESDVWDGDEVYGREGGGVLFFPKFQCRQGRREVVRFARAIQRSVFERHPDVETAVGLRVYPDGSRRDEKWHRKAS
jgi:hemolysin-activating ACP:hemolysin acyltransferase